jgi:hypothetical protein
MSRRPPKPIRNEPPVRRCDVPGCSGNAHYRAPRSPRALGSYHWFCLEHVREYNRTWDFFRDMGPAEIEAYRHGANTWHRPTWRMGVNGHAKPAAGFRWGDASDPFDLFAEDGNPFEDAAPRPRVDRNVADALALLELAPMATAQDVRTRYKALAKKYHPDLNGGSKTAEERLKQINEAYSRLIAAGYA